MEEIKNLLEQRIAELYNADAAFCRDRWDMSKPAFERALYREQSNNVTFARQELQRILKAVQAAPSPKCPCCECPDCSGRSLIG